ncbi:MAG: hypothetical protein ACMG50_03230 [Thermomonas sp.]
MSAVMEVLGEAALSDGQVFIETCVRACANPPRMQLIQRAWVRVANPAHCASCNP